MNWNKIKYFTPIEGVENDKIRILGYFPYTKASCYGGPCIPRYLGNEIWKMLPNNIKDNKIVVIVQDKVRFGTNNFAIYFKDMFCNISKWDQVTDYYSQPLKNN